MANEKMFVYMMHRLGSHLAVMKSTAQIMEEKNPDLHQVVHWDELKADIDTLGDWFLDFSLTTTVPDEA